MPTGNAANPRGGIPRGERSPRTCTKATSRWGTSMSTRPASKPTTKSPCRCAHSTSSSLTAWWAGPPENTSPVMRYQSAGLDEWRTKTDHETAAMLTEQSVDGVVLAPNGPDCCKNVPVLARHLERGGIPTVLVTMMPDVAEKLDTPRIVGVEFPFGHAFGPADDRYTQRRVLETRSPYSAAHQNQAYGSTSTSNGPSKPEKHTKHGNQQSRARSSRRHWTVEPRTARRWRT